MRRTLGNKNRSIDSDCLVRVRFIVRTDGSCGGYKVGAGKAGMGEGAQVSTRVTRPKME
jgi:hypothetical protein